MRAALLFALALLAGCLAPTPDLSAAACTGAACAPPSLSFNGCVDVTAYVTTATDHVQQHLPPHYTAARPARIAVKVLQCRDAVIDNATVEHDTHLSFTLALIERPNASEPAGVEHDYAFEVAADNPKVVQLLRQAGFPAVQATIRTDFRQVPLRAAVHRPDSDYEFTAFGTADRADWAAETFRVHHESGGADRWLEFALNYDLARSTLAGPLDHSGSVIGPMMLVPVTPAPATMVWSEGRIGVVFPA